MAWIKQADAGYVAYYTLDSLRKLCHENNFDTSECKVKADFVQILQEVPEWPSRRLPPTGPCIPHHEEGRYKPRHGNMQEAPECQGG